MSEDNIFKGAIAITLIMIIFGVLGFKCTYRINPGFAGVIYNMDGGVQSNTLGQGWHMVAPWQSVTEYPVSTETVYYTLKNNDDKKKEDNSINVNSKDGKQVSVDVTYAYHMDTERLPELFTKFRGRQYLDIEAGIMKNEMYAAVNDVTSQYTLMDLVGDKRAEVNQKIFDRFKVALDSYGIALETFNLSDVRPDEATQEAIQNVVNAQNALAKSKVEKEQAEIEADKARVKAKGEADAAVISATGQAEANAKVQQSLTPLIIQYKAVSAWDGKMPQFMTNGGSGFMYNITQ